MMSRPLLGLLLLGLGLGRVEAASLTVSPINVTVLAPEATSFLTLKNSGNTPINAQVRVFKWSQPNGVDHLEPTDDVVASPPIATIRPGQDYKVRVIRTNAARQAPEDSYRIVIDELPSADRQKNGAVVVVLRYSVPAFFLSPDATQPKLEWRLESRGGKQMLVASNSGDKRARISDLTLGGKPVAKGLAGYVLGHSTKVWTIKSGAGGPVRATTEQGSINAPVRH